MPKGVYKHQPHSEACNTKISEAMKRVYAEGKHRITTPNKDKKLAEITIKKISLANTGKHFSPETEFKKGHKGFITNNHGGFKNGDKNINWINGRGYEPYSREFMKKRIQILQRDNFICQLCGDRIIEGRRIKNNPSKNWLTIHHIDYNKQNNNLSNLISLCNFCNISVNSSREQWTNYFQDKLNLNQNAQIKEI